MRTAVSLIAALVVSGCASGPFHTSATSPGFRKGDVAIARAWTKHPRYEGELVTVTGDMGWRWVKDLQGNAMRVYEVRTSDGRLFAAQEFQLTPVK